MKLLKMENKRSVQLIVSVRHWNNVVHILKAWQRKDHRGPYARAQRAAAQNLIDAARRKQ